MKTETLPDLASKLPFPLSLSEAIIIGRHSADIYAMGSVTWVTNSDGTYDRYTTQFEGEELIRHPDDSAALTRLWQGLDNFELAVLEAEGELPETAVYFQVPSTTHIFTRG